MRGLSSRFWGLWVAAAFCAVNGGAFAADLTTPDSELPPVLEKLELVRAETGDGNVEVPGIEPAVIHEETAPEETSKETTTSEAKSSTESSPVEAELPVEEAKENTTPVTDNDSAEITEKEDAKRRPWWKRIVPRIGRKNSESIESPVEETEPVSDDKNDEEMVEEKPVEQTAPVADDTAVKKAEKEARVLAEETAATDKAEKAAKETKQSDKPVRRPWWRRGGNGDNTADNGQTAKAETKNADPQAASAEQLEQIKKLVTTVTFSGDYSKQQAALKELVAMGDIIIPEVKKLLDDNMPAVRTMGIIALRDLKSEKTYPVLLSMLNDDDANIRYHAVIALRANTGANMGFYAYDTAERRKPAVDKWREWMVEKQIVAAPETKAETSSADTATKPLSANDVTSKDYWWNKSSVDATKVAQKTATPQKNQNGPRSLGKSIANRIAKFKTSQNSMANRNTINQNEPRFTNPDQNY